MALAVVPLLTVIGLTAPRARWAALAVYFVFVIAFAGLHFWIWDNAVSRFGYPIIALCLGLYPAAFVAGLVLMRKRAGALGAIAFAPAWWIALEALRGEVVLTGYPWYLVGVPMIDAPLILRGGPYDTGLLAITLCLPALILLPRVRQRVLADAAHPRAWQAALPTVLALPIAVATLVAGWLPERSGAGSDEQHRSVVVGIVQTNVPQDNRKAWTLEQRVADFKRFIALTLAASETPIVSSDGPRRADLIVWPETMYPGEFGLTPEAIERQNEAGLEIAAFANQTLMLSQYMDIPMIVGAVVHEDFQPITVEGEGEYAGQSFPWFETRRRFNSAFVLRQGRVETQRYDKIDLTLFGEQLPYVQSVGWLKAMIAKLGADSMPFDLEAGSEPVRLTVVTAEAGPVVIGTPICFEASLARATRRLAINEQNRLALDLLINMTNDGWFGSFPGGQATHLLHARWRAAELRTPLLRAANTGISAWIDADGTVIQRGPMWTVDPASGQAVQRDDDSPAVNVDGFLLAEVPIRAMPSGAGDRPRLSVLAFARRGNLPAAVCLWAGLAAMFWFMLTGANSRNPES